MEVTILSIFFICLLPLLFIVIFRAERRRKLPYPPGPKGYPVIGSMLMMDQLTHHGLAKLAQQYGGLCHFKMGMVHMVAVSTPKMAQEVLQAQDEFFSNRPKSVATTYLSYERAGMAFTNYGPFWRQMRKICVMKLFSRKWAKSWASVREEVDSLVQEVEMEVGKPINIGKLVSSMTKNVTYRAAFGSMSREGQEEFLKIMQEFSKLFGAFNIADFFPSLGGIFGKGFNKTLEKARKSLDVFIDTIIDDHIAKRKNFKIANEIEVEDDDMVDNLMEFYTEDDNKRDSDSDELKSSFNIKRDNIKALIMEIMFGGTETVASAIEWTMAELMKNQEELRKVQQELADIVGLHRQVEESDLENLTYLNCVIKETLRLHPPIPIAHHETSEDCAVAGYKIPAKARIMINLWAINRDKMAWEEPDKFKPSRFTDSVAPDYKGSHFEYIPFGSGRRSCPGMQLGLYTLRLTVAKLCHCFTWELPGGMEASELDMNDAFGVTAPRAIQLVAVPSDCLRVNLSRK